MPLCVFASPVTYIHYLMLRVVIDKSTNALISDSAANSIDEQDTVNGSPDLVLSFCMFMCAFLSRSSYYFQK